MLEHTIRKPIQNNVQSCNSWMDTPPMWNYKPQSPTTSNSFSEEVVGLPPYSCSYPPYPSDLICRSSHMRTAVQLAHNKLYPITSPLATRHSANDNTQNWFYPALPNKQTHRQTASRSRVHSRFPRQPIKTAPAFMQKSSPSCIRLTIKYE